METQQKVINIVFATILAALAGFATIIVLDDEGIELEFTHYCESRQLKMYCARTTAMYCRPSLNTTRGSKKCNEGWKLIPIAVPKEQYSGTQTGEVCNSQKCWTE